MQQKDLKARLLKAQISMCRKFGITQKEFTKWAKDNLLTDSITIAFLEEYQFNMIKEINK